MLGDAIEPGWNEVRRIIRNWLTLHGQSQRNLAARLNIANSVISRFLRNPTQKLDIDTATKLYCILGPEMSDMDRRTFLKVTGLLALASAVRYNPFFELDRASLNLAIAPPEQLGIHLMAEANNIAQDSWAKAIPIYRASEEAFRATSSQAPFAGTMVAQMLINLCDYEMAMHEVERIRSRYGKILDPKTDAELHRIAGWLHYYQGGYPQAVTSLDKCWHIAQEYGDEYLGESAQHFKGRTYRDWGEWMQANGRLKEANKLFNASRLAFKTALRIHERFGNDDQAAYDLLRDAQLLHVQGGDADEARRLRIQARGRYCENRSLLHLDLEEASLALENGEAEVATHKASEVLEGWIDIKYAKGISDSLYVLGEVHRVNLRLGEALNAYIAALCIYPYENNLRNWYLWKETIPGILADLDKQLRAKGGYPTLLRSVQVSLEERQGPFVYLDHTYAKRAPQIEQIFNKLTTLRL